MLKIAPKRFLEEEEQEENLGEFWELWFNYTSGTEVPQFFYRWAMIAGVGAFIGRQFQLSHGFNVIRPNIYCMLIGLAGTRKSTGIKLVKSIMKEAGYGTIAADRTTKEKFLLDLAGLEEGPRGALTEKNSTAKAEDVLDSNLWGELGGDIHSEPHEMFIMADEANDFFGINNVDFLSILGSLWDQELPYENKIKNGVSVRITEPYVSILAGNTPENFTRAFPPELLTQGFFSRMLLVHSDRSEVKIPFPETPPVELRQALIKHLVKIKEKVSGEATITEEAKEKLGKIYIKWEGIDDVRFDSYANRRFNHLIKLCLIGAACRLSSTIEAVDVIWANTILSHTEYLMPRALGEFGRSKHATVSHKVLQVLLSSDKELGIQDIWSHVHTDLEKLADLQNILHGLIQAGKAQMISGPKFLPMRKPKRLGKEGFIDESMLTKMERGMT